MPNFNPRSHERSDLGQLISVLTLWISIHAPTRGATNGARVNIASYSISIHAPTRGATRHAVVILCAFIYFNPRSHERSDEDAKDICKIINISIHAPTRGATINSLTKTIDIYISIHAPTRGATAILHKKFVYFYTIPTINI